MGIYRDEEIIASHDICGRLDGKIQSGFGRNVARITNLFDHAPILTRIGYGSDAPKILYRRFQ